MDGPPDNADLGLEAVAGEVLRVIAALSEPEIAALATVMLTGADVREATGYSKASHLFTRPEGGGPPIVHDVVRNIFVAEAASRLRLQGGT